MNVTLGKKKKKRKGSDEYSQVTLTVPKTRLWKIPNPIIFFTFSLDKRCLWLLDSDYKGFLFCFESLGLAIPFLHQKGEQRERN